jgi:drug/metabolite transporter (DMT)-like permease
MINLTNKQKGIFLAFTGVLIVTPDSLLIRMVSLDTWNLLFYRSLFPSCALLLGYFILFKRRTISDFYNIGFPGIANAAFVLGANITFILALANTDVANVLVMISLIPLIAALCSVIFLKEKPEPITWTSMSICLLAIIFIFHDSLSSGKIVGDFFALLAACCVGMSLTVMRSYKEINFVPSYILGKFSTAIFALPFVTSFVINDFDLLFTLLMIITVGFSFVFISLAPQYISSPEVGIFFLLETALGPLWVWFFINENPSINVLIGGIIIVLTIFGHSYYMIRRD